jgi:hypothetical protein
VIAKKVSDYLADVESAVVRAMHAGAEADSDVWYAVEDAVPPCGFKDGKRQFARPSDILALGQTLGWARHVVLTLTSPSRLVLVVFLAADFFATVFLAVTFFTGASCV